MLRPMMNMRSICLFVSVFWVTVSGAQTATHKAVAVKRTTAVVAAANPMAADAGMEILRKGGDAVVAAAANQAMLGLVEPQSSGVGGGSFFMYYSASTGEVLSLDGRERAPAGAKPDMFLDEHGKPLPFFQAVRSGRSTGVPGTFAMLAEAHSKLG